MLLIQPTHIGLDIAEQIMQELQPETSTRITDELLGTINALLNQSIGLEDAGLYRIANRILTLLPFDKELYDRIAKNNAQENIDIYLIHLIGHGKYCYCKPLHQRNASKLHHLSIMSCAKITL